MFNKGRTKTLLTLAGVSAGLWISLSVTHMMPESVCQSQLSPHSHSVMQIANADNQCSFEESVKVSWLSWVSGKSISYQFHFLDLLELLYRNSSEFTSNIRE